MEPEWGTSFRGNGTKTKNIYVPLICRSQRKSNLIIDWKDWFPLTREALFLFIYCGPQFCGPLLPLFAPRFDLREDCPSLFRTRKYVFCFGKPSVTIFSEVVLLVNMRESDNNPRGTGRKWPRSRASPWRERFDEERCQLRGRNGLFYVTQAYLWRQTLAKMESTRVATNFHPPRPTSPAP